MVNYREALALLDKLSYVDGMSSDNIDILIFTSWKNQEIVNPDLKNRAYLRIFYNKLKQQSIFLDKKKKNNNLSTSIANLLSWPWDSYFLCLSFQKSILCRIKTEKSNFSNSGHF